MGTIVVTPAARLAVTLEDAKSYLRVDAGDDDRDIVQAVKAATAWVENYIGQSTINRTLAYACNDMPEYFEPKGPLVSITSLAYTDADGNPQTVDAGDMVIDTYSLIKPRVSPAYGATWPTSRGGLNDVVLTYVAGYGTTPEDIPGDISEAIKRLVGHLYETRQTEVTGTVIAEHKFGLKELLMPHCVLEV